MDDKAQCNLFFGVDREYGDAYETIKYAEKTGNGIIDSIKNRPVLLGKTEANIT